MNAWRCLCAGVLAAFGGPLWAACGTTATVPLALGTATSTAVRTSSLSGSTSNAGLTCSGTAISLLSANDHFYATVTAATTGLIGPSADVVPYTLYANGTTSFPLTRGTRFDFARNGLVDALGLLNGSTPKSIPLFVRSTAGANVAAGVYRETLSILWEWNYCATLNALGICLNRDTGSSTQTLTVTLTVSNDCQITAGAVAFGSAPVVAAFGAVSQTLNVACTKGSTYTVGLGDGENPANGRRRMRASNTAAYLAYDLYKGGSTVRWGASGSARRASSDADVNPGAGTGTGSQLFNYTARIYTDQATPGAGTYTDNVVVDVLF